jgi:hypothetical protein
MICKRQRRLISVEAGRNRHDVYSYECPGCGEIFRLVVGRESSGAEDLVLEET